MNKTVVISGFPIDEHVSLRKHGTHFDLHFEIVNHSRRTDGRNWYCDEPRGTWNYYVSVYEESLVDPGDFEEFWLPVTNVRRRGGTDEPTYDYWAPRFASAEWHGGVTFYEKRGGIDGAPRGVKIGCDFAHSWDAGRSFTYSEVEREAKQTIEALREMYPFRRRCTYSWLWLPVSEMVEHNGRLYSHDAFAKITAARQS